MDKTTLLALADRVEALTGPDTTVDELCLLAKGWTLRRAQGLGERATWVTPEGKVTAHRQGDGWFKPSSSIEAAMTLVPGTTIAASFDWPPGIEGATCGAVLTLVTLEGTRDVKAVSCTPAAALTAAALRAIAGGEDA